MDYNKKLKFYNDFKTVAFKNYKLFDEPYRSYLLNMVKEYSKAIKWHPYKMFARNIRLKTKGIDIK